MADRSSDMTLAFTLEALRSLAEPAAAVEDARSWSEHVGAVSRSPNGALTFTRDRRIRLDFFSGTRPPSEALYGAGATYPTERHVLVGVPEEGDLAAEVGWEFQSVTDAAERAGWALGGDDSAAGPVDRAVDRLRGVLGR